MKTEFEITTFDKFFNNKFVKILLTFIAIIGTIVTVYSAFFQEKKVSLDYVILSNINVLDINADITRLDIQFDSISLKSKNENIKIINLKVVNNGSKNITLDFYDDNDPIGFKLSNGYIVDKPELITSSNEYLKRNLLNRIKLESPNKVTFPKIILEANEYFIIKLLIIHKLNEIPEIYPFGKIAGQKEIRVSQIFEKSEAPILVQTFQGNIWIQLLRFIAYLIFTILILVGVIYVFGKIIKFKSKRKKKHLIKNFKKWGKYSYNRMDDALFDRYILHGDRIINSLYKITSNSDELNTKYISIIEKNNEATSNNDRTLKTSYYSMFPDSINNVNINIINNMIKDGLLIKQDNKIIINQTMRKTLELFVEFLKKNKA